MMTYWLKYGKQFVGTVRARPGLGDESIRRMALEQHDRIPLNDSPNETPYERRTKIERATIHIYRGEG